MYFSVSSWQSSGSVSNAMQRLGGSISALTTSIVRASHVFDFMELDMEEQINRLTGENPGKEVFKGESSDVFGKGQPVLEISDLQFSYNDNDKLKDKSKDCAKLCCGKMQIRAGEKIMLTGESGCGKSTLLKLIQGFYPVENEKITIGGKDINEYELDELRNIIAYVPQDSYLFEGTIAENIAFGWNGENVPSMDTLNFRTVTNNAIKLHEPRQHNIDLRAAQQQKDTVKGTTEVVSVKHILVVTPKKLNPGKVATAAAAEVSGEYAVSYYATYINGKKKLEIDPLNYIYYVNGKDYLADVRKALGK